MAKRTIAEITAAKEKKRSQLTAQIKQLKARANKTQRQQDTRRKILAGAAVLDEAESHSAYKAALYELIERFYDRDDERALFDLPPLSEEEKQARAGRRKERKPARNSKPV